MDRAISMASSLLLNIAIVELLDTDVQDVAIQDFTNQDLVITGCLKKKGYKCNDVGFYFRIRRDYRVQCRHIKKQFV